MDANATILALRSALEKAKPSKGSSHYHVWINYPETPSIGLGEYVEGVLADTAPAAAAAREQVRLEEELPILWAASERLCKAMGYTTGSPIQVFAERAIMGQEKGPYNADLIAWEVADKAARKPEQLKLLAEAAQLIKDEADRLEQLAKMMAPIPRACAMENVKQLRTFASKAAYFARSEP